MKRNYSGCALCDATWGNYWREIEGENTFFCCNICADAYENIVSRVKQETGWDRIDYMDISGNYSSGRTCYATRNAERLDFFFRHEDGEITEFRKLDRS